MFPKICEISAKLTIQILERSQWRCSGVSIVDFGNIHTWDDNDNNNDDNSHVEDVNRTDFTINFILFF